MKQCIEGHSSNSTISQDEWDRIFGFKIKPAYGYKCLTLDGINHYTSIYDMNIRAKLGCYNYGMDILEYLHSIDDKLFIKSQTKVPFNDNVKEAIEKAQYMLDAQKVMVEAMTGQKQPAINLFDATVIEEWKSEESKGVAKYLRKVFCGSFTMIIEECPGVKKNEALMIGSNFEYDNNNCVLLRIL